jgi:hypothetical protein
VLERILERAAAEGDANLRRSLLAALGAAEAPDLAARALRVWVDHRFTPADRVAPALAMALQRRIDPILDGLDRDLDEVLASRDENLGRSWVATLLRAACDERSAGRARALVEPRLARHPELEAGLRQAVEQARLCAGRRDAVAAEALDFFRAMGPDPRARGAGAAGSGS